MSPTFLAFFLFACLTSLSLLGMVWAIDRLAKPRTVSTRRKPLGAWLERPAKTRRDWKRGQ